MGEALGDGARTRQEILGAADAKQGAGQEGFQLQGPGRPRASVVGASAPAPPSGATLESSSSRLGVQDSVQGGAQNDCYDMCVIPARPSGMLLDQVGVDFIALENRVAELERQMRVDYEVLPPVIRDLKQQVTRFRTKLETTEHLGWMGYYKELPPPEDCRRLQYRRKSHELHRKVKYHFLEICESPPSDETQSALRTALFDCSPLSDAEILGLLEWMYHDFGLPHKYHIETRTLRAFLYEVYKHYNEVPFHNFRHGFCVTQMMYAMAYCVDIPNRVGDLETLILITSCICHDLDHPGYNNIYQINARTELALRYNDISPLENHHCSVAFRILELPECNILSTLAPPVFRAVREGIIRCILATDMARHNEILAQFKDITPEFDFSNKAHTDLLSMVLIKVADISNEARPMHVADPWLDRLLQEFFKQSDAEKLEGLPVTSFMDRDKITKPSSQCSFIGFVVLPLFEALGTLLPELHDMIVKPVREALEYYRRLNEQSKEERIHRKSIVDLGDQGLTDEDRAMVKSGSGHSVKSRKAFQARSRSRSVEDEGLDVQGAALSADELMENVEEGDEEAAEGCEEDDEEETANEVEVSEKTLKFKISTESGRKSYPGSRKGSRDKNQLSTDIQHHEFTRAVREVHDLHLQLQRGVATSPSSGRSVEFSRCNGDKEKCLSFEDDTLSPSSHSPCSGTGSKRDSAGAAVTAGSGGSSGATGSCTAAELQDSTATAASLAASATSKQRSPSSLLKKIKTLTDRWSFNVSVEKDVAATCQPHWRPTTATSPCHASSPARDSTRATLPAAAARGGWRSLLGSDRDSQPTAPSRSRTGSLESILQKGEPSVNNNNRKKANFWSSPGSRRGGFLTRLASGKQSTDSISSSSSPGPGPGGSGSGSGSVTPRQAGQSGESSQHGLIATLAASFRSRKQSGPPVAGNSPV